MSKDKSEEVKKKCCHYPGVGHCWHCENRNKEIVMSQVQYICPDWKGSSVKNN